MSVKAGPKIVKEGLIFDLDAAVSRSYSGSGLTANTLVGGIGITLVNGVGFTSTNNGSFIFDGSNDYIITPYDPVFAFGLNDFTISGWFKSSDKSRYSCILSSLDSGDNGIILYSNAGNGFLRTWIGNNLLIGTIDITNNLWSYVTLKRSSGTATQFVNGIQDVSSSSAVSIINNNVKIGGVPPYNYYCLGNISQIKIYNRALSQQEILQNYNATKGRYI